MISEEFIAPLAKFMINSQHGAGTYEGWSPEVQKVADAACKMIVAVIEEDLWKKKLATGTCVTKRCRECGGDNVGHDAHTVWDDRAQDWTLGSDFDGSWCSDCGSDVEIDEYTLDADGNPIGLDENEETEDGDKE